MKKEKLTDNIECQAKRLANKSSLPEIYLKLLVEYSMYEVYTNSITAVGKEWKN